ncbi:hypothetical protein BDU57DRAFT_514535 [Ampelomyces quisqualis]|uniref:BPL/LPL catalytic domain-containing protein n=1 Tax=Ampelomyces quisqualis TaxID=50730 RepID=A0A6A5QRL2_AMPQU|nr:hypothetical protein BDU57DRAFT_514535 [Ampelomyces quisqualis]
MRSRAWHRVVCRCLVWVLQTAYITPSKCFRKTWWNGSVVHVSVLGRISLRSAKGCGCVGVALGVDMERVGRGVCLA